MKPCETKKDVRIGQQEKENKNVKNNSKSLRLIPHQNYKKGRTTLPNLNQVHRMFLIGKRFLLYSYVLPL